MKAKLFFIFLLFSIAVLTAQIEGPSSLRIDSKSSLNTDKYSLSNFDSKIESSSLYNLPEELEEYSRRNNTAFNMTGDDGFIKPNTEMTPKWFKKIEGDPMSESETDDAYLGDFNSNGEFVNLIYRDHGIVDGDVIRIFINDNIIASRVLLNGDFQGAKINLIKGFNKIVVQALSVGEVAPNTAEFHLYDDQGKLITGNGWNLSVGKKATMVVVKN